MGTAEGDEFQQVPDAQETRGGKFNDVKAWGVYSHKVFSCVCMPLYGLVGLFGQVREWWPEIRRYWFYAANARISAAVRQEGSIGDNSYCVKRYNDRQ